MIGNCNAFGCSYRWNESCSFFFQQLMESVEGSSLRVYSQHLPYGFTYQNCCGSGQVTAASNIYFVKEESSPSGELGIKKDNILHAIFGRCSKYSFWPWVPGYGKVRIRAKWPIRQELMMVYLWQNSITRNWYQIIQIVHASIQSWIATSWFYAPNWECIQPKLKGKNP